MLQYVLRRIAWTIVVLWAIVTLTFGATFLSPIDPARAYAGNLATPAVLQVVRHEFGLDQPIWVQYGRYLERLAHGDFGTSIITGQSVSSTILNVLPNTILLACAGMTVQLLVGLPLGFLAALNRGRLVDRAVLVFSLVGVVMPTFVLGFLLLYVLAFKYRLFPLGGTESFGALVLPGITLGVAGAAWYARMLRSSVLNILGEDYVRLVRAKGLPERVVLFRHVLLNSIGPIITMIGLDMGIFLGGVLVVERVFAWPGIGGQAWQAISSNDIPLVMGTVLFAAFFVALFNLAADLANALIDPRVKL
jgi:peptide/nickel transport system permease protein